MFNYAFILGRKNLLSIAELCNVLNPNQITEVNPDALIANFNEPLNEPQIFLNKLGGTIKIAEIFSEASNQNEIAPKILEFLENKFKDQDKKVNYGVSVYNLTEKHEHFLNKILIFLKKNLKNVGIKSRFINHNFQNLENAAIKGEKLIGKGAEIIIIENKNKFYLGKTIALQDFENYSYRDYNRPERDARLGMLPPKLAQIMINLTGVKKGTIYDPFVGIGTILTEGLLMGYDVIGSDINAQVVEKSKKNVAWILNNEPAKTKLFVKDATFLKPQDLPEKIDAVITESFLGPPLRELPTEEQIRKNFTNISIILNQFFQAISKILKPGTPVVISFVYYQGKKEKYFLENLTEKITQLGFKIEGLIPKNLNLGLKKQSLLYDREDQVVGREIWKFRKM